LEDRIIVLETKLEDLIQVLPKPVTTHSSETLVLTRTSTLIHNAAKIYFYTSLHSALPSTHTVRNLVAEQVLLLQSIPTLQSAHLWSIFVTALYALDDEQRIFFLEHFDRLEVASATRSSMHAARTIVQTVWKKRDLGADSEQSVEVGKSDWVKYVRPMSEGLSLA
jgi:Fungal specific transcription factor domain